MAYFAYNMFEGPTRNYYLLPATMLATCIIIMSPLLALLGVVPGRFATNTHIIIGLLNALVQMYVVYFNINIMFTSTRATVASLACHLKKYSRFLRRKIASKVGQCQPNACGNHNGHPVMHVPPPPPPQTCGCQRGPYPPPLPLASGCRRGLQVFPSLSPDVLSYGHAQGTAGFDYLNGPPHLHDAIGPGGPFPGGRERRGSSICRQRRKSRDEGSKMGQPSTSGKVYPSITYLGNGDSNNDDDLDQGDTYRFHRNRSGSRRMNAGAENEGDGMDEELYAARIRAEMMRCDIN